MKSYYLVIPELRVEAASAANNALCSGFPSLTSFAGWAEALSRMVTRLSGLDCQTGRFGVLVHDSAMRASQEGQLRGLAEQRSNVLAGKHLAARPEHKCDMTITLVLEVLVPEPGPFDPAEQLFDVIMQSKIGTLEAEILAMRACSGRVASDGIEVSISDSIGSTLERLAPLSPGYFMTSAMDQLEHYADLYAGDYGKAILHACAIFSVESNEASVSHSRAQSGWVTPTNVGYWAVSSPSIREGARSEHESVHVEPVTGLVEYRYSPRLLRLAKEDPQVINSIFFRAGVSDGYYFVN